MSLRYNLVIVSGLHRSGTTYIGNIISQNSKVQTIHEPSNYNRGIKGVPMWYPYSEPDSNDSNIENLYNAIIQFDRSWNKKHSRKAGSSSGLKIRLVANRQSLTWSKLKLRKLFHILPETICWKDPFVTFSLQHLINIHNARVVCMVRHPGALYFSNKRQKWEFDINNLLFQKSLINKYGADISEKYWDLAFKENAASIAILWKIMSRVVTEIVEETKSLLIIRHEDFSREPVDLSKRICKHFNVDFTERMEQYIVKTTQGEKVDATNGIAHSFCRNSEALINNWRGKLDHKDVKIIRTIIGQDLLRFYEEW